MQTAAGASVARHWQPRRAARHRKAHRKTPSPAAKERSVRNANENKGRTANAHRTVVVNPVTLLPTALTSASLMKCHRPFQRATATRQTIFTNRSAPLRSCLVVWGANTDTSPTALLFTSLEQEAIATPLQAGHTKEKANSEELAFLLFSYGAADRNRTGDLRITNALLYQLSYSGDKRCALYRSISPPASPCASHHCPIIRQFMTRGSPIPPTWLPINAGPDSP
jgi:hypothetical protein